MQIKRHLIAGDFHIPWHDTKAVKLVLDIFEDLDLDHLILNGDILDFYNVNMHGPKHPEVVTTLEDELIAGREFFEGLRKRFKDKEITHLWGNHIHRLERFILKHAKPFWNIVTPDKYIDYDTLNISQYPYQYKYQIQDTNCYVMHSPPSYGQNGARTSLLKKLDQTFIYGCTHRQQSSFITGASGEVHGAYFNGWLGSVDETPEHKEIFSYAKGHQDWQQCFIIVTVIDGVEFHINQYSIRNHRCVVDGNLYEAS
jgi:predicted phosphodiesterase